VSITFNRHGPALFGGVTWNLEEFTINAADLTVVHVLCKLNSCLQSAWLAFASPNSIAMSGGDVGVKTPQNAFIDNIIRHSAGESRDQVAHIYPFIIALIIVHIV